MRSGSRSRILDRAANGGVTIAGRSRLLRADHARSGDLQAPRAAGRRGRPSGSTRPPGRSPGRLSGPGARISASDCGKPRESLATAVRKPGELDATRELHTPARLSPAGSPPRGPDPAGPAPPSDPARPARPLRPAPRATGLVK